MSTKTIRAQRVKRARSLNLLLVPTSYDTFRELRQAGPSDWQAVALLQEPARELLATAGRG